MLVDRAQYAAALYRLLPAVYRVRDTQGELQRFVGLFADELWRMRARLDRQWRDLYIDSCQDWVIPYLAELVGSSVLYDDAARNRVDVKNTMRWRRQKGTVAGLEDIAAGVGGWGALVAEMFERTVWMQNLVHIKRTGIFAPDLRDGNAMAALGTPFSRAHVLVDLRPADQRAGWFGPRKLAVFEWPLTSYPLDHVTPAALSGGRFRFAPLGHDTALYAGGDRQNLCSSSRGVPADICYPHADHLPMRTRDVATHAAVYVGTPLGFTLSEDGIALVCALPASTAPSQAPCLDYPELATSEGLIAADTTLFSAPGRFRLEAVRLGAVLQLINSTLSPIPYSGGQPWAAQLQLRNAHGTLGLDPVTPDFGFLAGVAPYQPDHGEFHHPVLLLRLTNIGAVAASFPESEVIVRSAAGAALQVFLPAIANTPAASQFHLYVAADGSTYFARADHGAGVPDRNPDASLFGAYLAPHLARAAEAQVRLRPGHLAAPNRFRRAVLRSLCCWDKPLTPPLASGEVAIDPERGRFAFPPAEVPAGRLSVSFRYGFTAEIGAGPYARGQLAPATITVAQTRNADHASLQAAINAAPDGAASPVVIEVLDSATYNEALLIANRHFPGGLVLQAADQQTPTLVKAGGGTNLLTVQNSAIARLQLDGLVLAGGNVDVSGAIGQMVFQHCSASPSSVSLSLTSANANLRLAESICGPIAISAPDGSIEVSDSIVQHPAATVETASGNAALAFANGTAKLERATIIGDVALHSGYFSNLLLYGALALADSAASCLRFSRVPPALASSGFRCTGAVPIFVSLRFGDAGYCHLHPNTANALTRGAEEGGEIGAFYRTGLPWRTQNVGVRLDEYVPAGLEAVQIRVLPRLRFLGNPVL
jgi:hypothetical protein